MAGGVSPVVVRCHLCPDDDGRIVTVAARAYRAAMDHALDHHRPELLVDPDATQASFTVGTSDRDVHPLQRPDRSPGE